MSRNLKSEKYKAIGILKVNVSKTLLDAKKKVWSSPFSCPDDPHSPEFGFKLEFGRKEDGYLSCNLKNASKRNVFVHFFETTLCNEAMRVLKWAKRLPESHNLKVGFAIEYPDFFSLRNVVGSEEIKEWNVIVTVVYDGVSIDTNFLDERSCKNDVPNDMLKLLESGTDADIVLHVGDETWKAHKNILKIRSPYFQNMLDSGMRESQTNEVVLRDVDPAIFEEVLKFLYSGLPPKNLPSVAMELFALADRFGILDLKKMCISAIHSVLSAENVVDALILADLYAASDLKDVCVPVFKKNKRKIKRDNLGWNRLGEYPHILMQLLAECF